MALTDTAVRLKKAGTKPEKLFDERGLYLLVAPSGGKWWRLKYRFAGKEKLLSLGIYPDTTLSKAREKRDEARRLIADGIDPSVQRQAREGRARARRQLRGRRARVDREVAQRSGAESSRRRCSAGSSVTCSRTIGERPVGDDRAANCCRCSAA